MNDVPVIKFSERFKRGFTCPVTKLTPTDEKVETRIDGELVWIPFEEWAALFADGWMRRRRNPMHRCAIVINRNKNMMAVYSNVSL